MSISLNYTGSGWDTVLNKTEAKLYDCISSADLASGIVGAYPGAYITYNSDDTISAGKVSIDGWDKERLDELKKSIEPFINETFNKTDNKEKENMFENLGLNFGPMNRNTVRMSPFGMAVSVGSGNSRKWFVYDSKNHKMMDVSDFSFEVDMDIYYKIPVTPTAIKENDIIIQNDELFFVTGFINPANKMEGFRGINVRKSKVEEILPLCNIFNFNFVTKVVPLFNLFGGNASLPSGTPSEDMPFGNIMPLIMLNAFKKEDGTNKDGFGKIIEMAMLTSMFSGDANPFAAFMGGNA